jgi:TonB family protein
MMLISRVPIFALASIALAQPNGPFAPGVLRPDGAYQAGSGVSAPAVMFRTSCETPDLARKLRAQGDVTLSLIVKADGSVHDVRIVKPAGYGIDEKIAECVLKWRFKPGTRDGSPVDVAFQFGYDFRLAPQARLWGAGPLIFAVDSGVTAPVLKSGTIPTAERDTGDEAVLLQFAVNPAGEVGEVQPLDGKDSKSLALLTKSLASWKFKPAANATEPITVTGKVLFIKGEDYFRYQVYKAFRDSGSVHPPESKPVDSAAPKSIVTIKVPVRITLESDEATKQLVDHVAPEYPAEAKAAHVQGTVSLLVTIAKDGSITDVKEISGPPQLIPAAVAAVKQWRYRPILSRSGQPTEASTVVDIPFKLPE